MPKIPIETILSVGLSLLPVTLVLLIFSFQVKRVPFVSCHIDKFSPIKQNIPSTTAQHSNETLPYVFTQVSIDLKKMTKILQIFVWVCYLFWIWTLGAWQDLSLVVGLGARRVDLEWVDSCIITTSREAISILERGERGCIFWQRKISTI